MKLTEWINEMSAPKVAKLLDVDPNTVYQWRDLKNLPKDELKMRIVEQTHGLVTYQEIIEPFFTNQN